MHWSSALAIYFLFWWLAAFLVLPFHARTSEDVGEPGVRGGAESAPHAFNWWRWAGTTTVVGAVLFGLYYLNYVNGWITPTSIDLFD